MNAMSDPTRGKTSAASTPGSFAPHTRSAGEVGLGASPTPEQLATVRQALAETELPNGDHGHQLGKVRLIPFARGLWDAECECSNPDGDGVGGVSFIGDTADEVRAQYLEHLAEVLP